MKEQLRLSIENTILQYLESEGAICGGSADAAKAASTEIVEALSRPLVPPSSPITLQVDSGHVVRVIVNDGGGRVESNLHRELEGFDDDKYNSAIDGFEAFLLAMACEGIDVQSEAMKRAVVTTLDAIANNS